MKSLLTLLLLFISLNAFNQQAYCAAENGLTIRLKPDTLSQIKGKLSFGEKVQIIERTKVKMSIVDNGGNIEARWYKISSLKNKSDSGYVFSAFLTGDHISKKKELQLNGYTLTISESSKAAFTRTQQKLPAEDILDKDKCLEQGFIQILSEKELEVKLTNNTFLKLKKELLDDQFFGYTFLHFDSKRKIYFLWENWLEAGHPIMINASTGKITEVVGSAYSINSNKNILALYGEDIGSGWTPNGIQLVQLDGEHQRTLFTFNPLASTDELWGPMDIAWENDSTLLIACLMHNSDSGYVTIYKKLQFEKN